MGKFSSELSACHTSIFLFLDNNFSKYQWIFTKLGKCTDIVEICFGIANEQTMSTFNRVICQHNNDRVLSFDVLFILICKW